MSKDKYDFIQNILVSRKLSIKQQEKLFALTSVEIKRDKELGVLLEERVAKLEEKLNGEFKNENEKSYEEPIKKINGSKHRPKETYELLNYFSSNDGGMKNLTHSFNYGYIAYDELMKNCKEEFELGKQKYPFVPEALLTRIEHFAFLETPNWYFERGEEKIYKNFGWSEPKFVEWYKENKTHPANDSFYNTEMILPFKQTIQVRTDLGNLIKLLNDLSELVFQNDIKLHIKNTVNSAQFYTDVDRLGIAIYHLFVAIKQASSKNFCDEVEVDFKIKNSIKILEIIHLDSTPTKSVDDFDFLGGDLSSVKNNLWSLCNYDILAKFSEGEFRKVILSDKVGETEKNNTTGKWLGKNYPITEEQIKGFTHVLKFY